jgi:hypothetical protein
MATRCVPPGVLDDCIECEVATDSTTAEAAKIHLSS